MTDPNKLQFLLEFRQITFVFVYNFIKNYDIL